jgi:hypothetical protein
VFDSGCWGEWCNLCGVVSFSKKARKEDVGSFFNQPKTASRPVHNLL